MGSRGIITETRLPNARASSAVLTETGTMASSGLEGSSSCSINQRRSAVVQSARTTSLTVTPKAFFTRLTSSSGSDPNATRRCGVILRLKDVRGGRPGGGWITPPSPSEGDPPVSRRAARETVPTPGTLPTPGTSARPGSVRGSEPSAFAD